MNAASRIREARSHAGLSQRSLADRSGTSQPTISDYESGRKQPSVETMTRVLAAAGWRLIAEPGRLPVIQPSKNDLSQAGLTLLDVLNLAEALPVRYERELRFPPLRTSISTAA